MGNLGNRMPSDLLAITSELWWLGTKANRCFLFLFQQRLPSNLEVLLGYVKNANR